MRADRDLLRERIGVSSVSARRTNGFGRFPACAWGRNPRATSFSRPFLQIFPPPRRIGMRPAEAGSSPPCARRRAPEMLFTAAANAVRSLAAVRSEPAVCGTRPHGGRALAPGAATRTVPASLNLNYKRWWRLGASAYTCTFFSGECGPPHGKGGERPTSLRGGREREYVDRTRSGQRRSSNED